MRLVVLLENTTTFPQLTAEHGLSLYLETGAHRILFDAGQSDAFADNAQKLGVDLAQVDFCVLSHGHYDHGGGLVRFLDINRHAPVYLSRHAFGQHWHGPKKYIGLDPMLQASARLRFIDRTTDIAPSLTLYPTLPCREPVEPFGLTRREGDAHLPEDFRHEQYLLVREGERHILLSGCSHRGIRNIAEHFAPDILIGGFHLSKVTAPDRLRDIASQLLTLPTDYYTGHCTGAAQFDALKACMGDRLHALSTGAIFHLF